MTGLTEKQLQQITRLASRITRNRPQFRESIGDILNAAVELTHSDAGTIYLLNTSDSVLHLVASKGIDPQEHLINVTADHDTLPFRAILSGQTTLIQDLNFSPYSIGHRTVAKSALISPITFASTPSGVLVLESLVANRYNDTDLNIVEMITSLLLMSLSSDELMQLREKLQDQPSPDNAFKEIVFVLMPFKEPFNKYYKRILKPAIEDAGFRALRADEIFGPGEIMQDLWSSLHKAKLVLAELTGRNPNVMYEVGLAHGIGKAAVLITQSAEDVPFDLRALRCIIYDTTDPDWAANLRRDLKNSIVATASNEARTPFDRGGSANPTH